MKTLPAACPLAVGLDTVYCNSSQFFLNSRLKKASTSLNFLAPQWILTELEYKEKVTYG